MAALWNRADHYIFILWSLLSFFFFLLFSRQRSEIGCLPYLHTWCGLSANLQCMSETCCTRLAGNTGRKNDAKKSPSGHHPTTLSGYIFATKVRIDNRKKLLSSSMFSTCPYNIVNFGILPAEIVSLVWGTPSKSTNFNGLRLGTVTARHSSIGRQPNFAALNRGRHLYSTVWPSGRALAHISSSSLVADCISTILPHMV